MSLTLNQIVKQITTLGNDHEQINFVYFGDVWERLSNGEVTYPAMFYTLTGATINAKNITYNFSLYFMDRMLMEETNETAPLKIAPNCASVIFLLTPLSGSPIIVKSVLTGANSVANWLIFLPIILNNYI